MTKRPNLGAMTVSELVDGFLRIALAQDDAILKGRISTYNRLFLQMGDVVAELRSRPGDQRTELLRLLAHPSWQVRLKAAIHTLAVAPEQARAQLEMIAASNRMPEAAEARSCLNGLDRGDFKPI